MRNNVILTVVLLFISLLLCAYSNKNPNIAKIGQSVIKEVEYPFLYATSSVGGFIKSGFGDYFNLVNVKEENRKLLVQLKSLEAKNLQLLESKKENERLSEILDFKMATESSGQTASVISVSSSSQIQSLTINKGSSSGLLIGQAVVVGNALVGQITSLSSSTASVLLISDSLSGVDSIIQETRVRGVARGVGSYKMEWKYIVREDKVVVGDRIITSGLDGVFPKGLSVGVVTEVGLDHDSDLFHYIKVEPSVSLSQIETVLVLEREDA